MEEQNCFVMDDRYEFEHRNDPDPIISDELRAELAELALSIMNDSSSDKVA